MKVVPKTAPKVPFVPERDTIFFGSLDHIHSNGLASLHRSISVVSKIQHLALPLPPHSLPLRNEWLGMLHDFDDPKALTFLVGGTDQSWVNEGEIELRDVEDWLVDGRDRSFRVNVRAAAWKKGG